MKVKLKHKNDKLPNCWKECGCSFEDWEDLQSGKSVEVSNLNLECPSSLHPISLHMGPSIALRQQYQSSWAVNVRRQFRWNIAINR